MTTIAQQKGITEFPYSEYDSNGNETYFENSDGWWWKGEYDSNGNPTYYETSDGDWSKREYDSNRKLIYSENSTGYIVDNRPKK